MIKLTKSAADKIKELLIKDYGENNNHCLRISVIGGGCSGLQYKLIFIENKDINKETDIEVEEYDIKAIVDNKSILYMMNSTIDYIDDLMSSGFKIINPMAKGGTCGCGESFYV